METKTFIIGAIIFIGIAGVVVFCMIESDYSYQTNFCRNNGYEGMNNDNWALYGYCYNIVNGVVYKRNFMRCKEDQNKFCLIGEGNITE